MKKRIAGGTKANPARPSCPHGPTLLFTTTDKGKSRLYYACSACRQRKDCNIFVWSDEPQTFLADYWKQKSLAFVANSNHRKHFLELAQVQQTSVGDRAYCRDCNVFQVAKHSEKHVGHQLILGISDDLLSRPTELLPALSNAKKEAQFLFEYKSCDFIADTLLHLGYTHVLCLGTPRLHEHIANKYSHRMESLLLDIDKRYMCFFSSMHFVWYNIFNHHFFQPHGKLAYEAFLANSKQGEFVVVTDPPFGGRVQYLAITLHKIRKDFRLTHNQDQNASIPLFWIFPYFMEGHIKKYMPDMRMLDYKVAYVNHPLFSDAPEGRKDGSPVRIFTNVDPGRIVLPAEDNYKFCDICKRWVAATNKHCVKCDSCTSKDGKTYVHCKQCEKCVKPTWFHCKHCAKCTHPEHECAKPAKTKRKREEIVCATRKIRK